MLDFTNNCEQIGLICRNCGGKYFKVIYTRKDKGGKIIRRRQCRKCGKRITTGEKIIG
jgi:transcriptional regulator NrdR family protein